MVGRSLFEVDVTFQTEKPLGQRATAEFWSHGTHFTAVRGMPGSRTYRFTMNIWAMSIVEGVAGAVTLVEMIIAMESDESVAIKKVHTEILGSDD